MIWCPEQLLRQVLIHIHYIPDEWKTKAHTNGVISGTATLIVFVP